MTKTKSDTKKIVISKSNDSDQAEFSKFTRFFAWIGLPLMILFSVIAILEAIIISEGIFDILWRSAMALGFVYFTWCCWYAAKKGRNPFNIPPFTLS